VVLSYSPSSESFALHINDKRDFSYGIVAPGAADFFSQDSGTGICRMSGSSYFSIDGSCGFSSGFIVLTILGVITKTSSESLLLNFVLLNKAPSTGMSPNSGNFVKSLTTL